MMKDSLPSKNITKINKIVNPELNILDSIINVDLRNMKLSNDVHKKNGLNDISKISKNREPTPVTLINVFGGKKQK